MCYCYELQAKYLMCRISDMWPRVYVLTHRLRTTVLGFSISAPTCSMGKQPPFQLNPCPEGPVTLSGTVPRALACISISPKVLLTPGAAWYRNVIRTHCTSSSDLTKKRVISGADSEESISKCILKSNINFYPESTSQFQFVTFCMLKCHVELEYQRP